MANDVKLEKVAAWYNSERKAIYISCDDPRLVAASGDRQGIVVTVSPSRQPKTFERLDRLLQDEGVKHPTSFPTAGGGPTP